MSRKAIIIFVIAVLAVCATLILSGCQDRQPEEIRYDMYEYDNPLEPIPSVLMLSRDDDSFQFVYSSLSSHIAVGRYEQLGDKLILITDDGRNVYVFNVTGEGELTFDAGGSSELPRYRYSEDSTEAVSPVPDGAVFSIGKS